MYWNMDSKLKLKVKVFWKKEKKILISICAAILETDFYRGHHDEERVVMKTKRNHYRKVKRCPRWGLPEEALQMDS